MCKVLKSFNYFERFYNDMSFSYSDCLQATEFMENMWSSCIHTGSITTFNWACYVYSILDDLHSSITLSCFLIPRLK